MKNIQVTFVSTDTGNCRDNYREIGRNGRQIVKFHNPDPDGRVW